MGKWNFSGAFASCLLPAALLLMAASQSAEAREIIDIDSDAAIDYYERHFDSQGFSRDGTRDGCTPSYEYDSDGKRPARRSAAMTMEAEPRRFPAAAMTARGGVIITDTTGAVTEFSP